jgi:hypothetical protein
VRGERKKNKKYKSWYLEENEALIGTNYHFIRGLSM